MRRLGQPHFWHGVRPAPVGGAEQGRQLGRAVLPGGEGNKTGTDSRSKYKINTNDYSSLITPIESGVKEPVKDRRLDV